MQALIASASSRIDCQRSSDFFSSALRMTFSYASGMSATSVRGASGLLKRCPVMISVKLSPLNGVRPAAISYMMMPSE